MRLGYQSTLARMLPLSGGLFRASLRAQQQRTLLGHLWIFLPAAAAALTASYIRSRGLFDFETPGMPYAVFVFAGTIFWQVFIESLNAPLAQLSAHRTIVTRLHFPHEGLILSGIWLALLNAAVRMIALLILCVALGTDLAASAVLMPAGVVALALLGLAFGLLLAPLGMLYDDVARGLAMATALLFFVMPIAYPIAGDGWQALNPVLPLINATRGWLVGQPATGIATPLVAAGVMLVLAWLLYRAAQPHVIERLG